MLLTRHGRREGVMKAHFAGIDATTRLMKSVSTGRNCFLERSDLAFDELRRRGVAGDERLGVTR